MSSKKAAAASVSGRKHKAPAPAADSDDEQFHDLPKETQPKKKQKKNAAAAAVPVLDVEAAAASAAQAAAAASKKGASAAASVAAHAASAARKNGGKHATVPVIGGAGTGADDEELESGDERDSDDEGKGVVKTLSKTAAKEARVWDRPAVKAADLLPNPQARTPSHTGKTASASASASAGSANAESQLLQPLASVPSANTAPVSKSNPSSRKVIIVLVKASLETVKTKKGYELVSADSHKFVLQKLKKNPSEYRPDILHQCLLTLLDSPLNKAGMLQVFVQTEKVRDTRVAQARWHSEVHTQTRPGERAQYSCFVSGSLLLWLCFFLSERAD